jgi:hypothetical protein
MRKSSLKLSAAISLAALLLSLAPLGHAKKPAKGAAAKPSACAQDCKVARAAGSEACKSMKGKAKSSCMKAVKANHGKCKKACPK